jgi:hypothetical protein
MPAAPAPHSPGSSRAHSAANTRFRRIAISPQARFDAFRADFEAGKPPYGLPRTVIETLHRSTAELIASGLGSRALKAGDTAPRFVQNDANGNAVASSALLAQGPLVILTGAGEAFIDSIDSIDAASFDFFTPRGYDKIYREGKKVLANLLYIPVPVIAALNGPTTEHSEYALLCDIMIATPVSVFQDKPHFGFGTVPGDGFHSLGRTC